MKILVCINGGVLQSLYVSPELAGAEIVLHDEDDLEGEGKTNSERDEIFEGAIEGLVPVNWDRTSPDQCLLGGETLKA